jgi:uracil-DNA glycosylase family 4
MFTGDRSGDWLFRALFRAGFANQPSSERRGDGLILTDCYVTATARCAPPQNILLQDEIKTCRRFLLQELESLPRLRVIVGLGGIGFRAVVESLDALKKVTFGKRPAFAHGAAYRSGGITLIASYHPSQQNTFTGRLTERMFDRVFLLARRRLDAAGKDLQEGTSL